MSEKRLNEPLWSKDLQQQMVSALMQAKTRSPGSGAQDTPKPQLKFMACLAGKWSGVIVGRKVDATTKKLLTELAGAAGPGRFYSGECVFEMNAHTFVLETVPPGLAKKLAAALLTQTGKKYKVRVRSADGTTVLDSDTEIEPDALATPGAASPAGTDTAVAFKQRLESLLPRVKDAISARTPGVEQAKAQLAKAGELAKHKDFAGANSALDKVEALLNGMTGVAGGPAEAAAAAPAEKPARILDEADFVSPNGKKLTVAKTATGRVRFTAPPPPVHEITFSGGGAKGSALPGAVKALHETGVLKDAKKIAGASVGSMTAALVAAGATAAEFDAIGNDDATTARIVEGSGGTKLGLLFTAMKNKVTTGAGNPLTGMGLEGLARDVLTQTMRTRVLEYLEQCGKNGKAPDENVVKIAKRLNSGKTGPTFMDYRQLSRVIPAIKEVVISGTYTEEFTTDDKGKKTKLKGGNEQGQLYVFDADSEPDLEVAVAVHASASFPAAFKPVDITLSSGLTVRFIDGGVMNNTPTSSSIGNERKLDLFPESRGMTFVFEDSAGTSTGLLQGKVAPTQGFAAKMIDWFVGADNNAAEYAKNRDMADRPEEIVVVPLQINLPQTPKGGKAQKIDMRDGTLNFGLSAEAKRALQAATESATKEQVDRESKPKSQEFASDSQMFVCIGMADLKTLKDNNYKGAGEAYAFRERVAANISKLRLAVKTEAAKPDGHIANLLKDKTTKGLLDELDSLAGTNSDFQGYVARELNKQMDLDILLETVRKGGVKNSVLDATFMVSEALRAHTHADNILKQLVYPRMKYEKKSGMDIDVLLTVERLLRAAKTADDVNAALTSAINHCKTRSPDEKKFAQELERRLMRKV